jgi:putative endonuclease
MFHVYIITSLIETSRTYVGYTTNIQQRLETHNSGGSVYTKSYRPWKLVSYVTFSDQGAAKKFEKYLKTASGKAFVGKHLLAQVK